MSDNTTLFPGAGGDLIATDDIGGVKHQQVKIEFGADGVATPVSTIDPLVTVPYSAEYANPAGFTVLRDQLVAQRYTLLADSIADGLAGFWTATTTGSASVSVTIGEGLLQTGTTAGSVAQLVSTAPSYLPGQVAWLNSAVRFADAGVAGSTLRVGACTVTGTTPQNGFFYELNGTTFNAVTVKEGVQTVIDSTQWSRFAIAPYALTTTYQQMELRFTANSANFFVNNILRHVAAGGLTTLTGTLNFPMFLQVTNTAGGTNRILGVRNIGIGRFGAPQYVAPSTQQNRALVCITFSSASAAAADTLLNVSITKGASITTGTTVPVTQGKVLKLTGGVVNLRTTTAAAPWGLLNIRLNPTGAAVLASPSILPLGVSSTAALVGSMGTESTSIFDGLEFSGANQLGFSFANNVNTNITDFSLFGYEYTPLA